MSSAEEWLIDKSALVRISTSRDAGLWTDRVQRGVVRIIVPTLLEIGYSARSGPDWHALVEGSPVALMPVESLTPQIERRALAVQAVLAGRGEHRAPSVSDLLIAATAEMAGLTVLHVDKDFDLIAGVTGQDVELLRIAS
ncbi:MAG: PIN domain nuclease [Marmoricola sp.]